MPRRVRLDADLTSRAFRVDEARDVGVGAGRLRSPDLTSPYRGVRVSSDLTLHPAVAYLPLLRPGDRFSHTTAAEAWGAPLPRSTSPGVHVSVAAGRARPRGAGVIGHREAVRSPAVLRHGLPVSDPLMLFRELAPLLSLEDLTAVGDHLVLDPRVPDPRDSRPHLAADALRAGLADAGGRGIRNARAAAELVREGVESRMETRLRLLCVGAGLPEPLCGYRLCDDLGRWIGWFDLAWPLQRTIAEYDGDQHRTSRAQYERDITRFDRATDAGWRVIRVRAPGLFGTPRVTLSRIAVALRAGGLDLPLP